MSTYILEIVEVSTETKSASIRKAMFINCRSPGKCDERLRRDFHFILTLVAFRHSNDRLSLL